MLRSLPRVRRIQSNSSGSRSAPPRVSFFASMKCERTVVSEADPKDHSWRVRGTRAGIFPCRNPVAVRAQLERILASPISVKAARSSDFLQFVVEQTLAGHEDQLKEYSIAATVLHRDASYDTQVDSGFLCLLACPLAVVIAVRPRGRIKAAPMSVAVLPFVDMSTTQDQTYICDGLTDEVINALSRVPRVRVAARTSVFLFKSKPAEIDDIGRRLRVDHVLEGSVRMNAGQIRVTAQLIKVADGYPVSSAVFTPGANGMFAVQHASR